MSSSCLVAPDDCSTSQTILPSLLLIGTRKGGTTALSSLLKLHPSIVMPNCSRVDRAQAGGVCWWDKEVRYFTRGFGGPARGGRQMGSVDLCWYRSLYPCVPPGAPQSLSVSKALGYVGVQSWAARAPRSAPLLRRSAGAPRAGPAPPPPPPPPPPPRPPPARPPRPAAPPRPPPVWFLFAYSKPTPSILRSES